MGNKAIKKDEIKPQVHPYKLKIELYGDKFNQRQSITGQVVLTLDTDYKSPEGLDSAEITLEGLESTRFCQ